jgi:phosphoglycolate phosphatase-like HAD superfamily hydrolase
VVNLNLPHPPDAAELVRRATFLLFDFDGPLVRLFARGEALGIARLLGLRLEEALGDAAAERFSESVDPHGLVLGLRGALRQLPDLDEQTIELLVRRTELQLVEEERVAVRTAELTDGAESLVAGLFRVGRWRLAITSNNSALAIDDLLEDERAQVFRSAFRGQVYGRHPDPDLMKPHPDCLNRALVGLGCDYPDQALLIGDSTSDLGAAKKAGVPFLGFAATEEKYEALSQAGARHIVRDLRELLSAAASY